MTEQTQLPKAPEISEDQLAAWRSFLRAHSAMLRRIGRDLEDAELPPLTWYDVLAALRDAPERSLRQVELAERVLLSNSGLSRLVDRIERRGLVERTSCPTDRRSFHVRLTDEGQEMLDAMWPVYARGVGEDFLPALGSNPCEVREMLDTIANTCEVARAADADPRSDR
jgi:DNA-binding MarR family transcriptional regulator